MMPGIGDTPLVGTDTGSYSGGSLDTQTVYVGASGSAANHNIIRGFVYGSLGDCSSGASGLYSGAQIEKLAAVEEISGDPNAFDLVFSVVGSVSNSGWNTINVGGGFILSRTDATFRTVGGNSIWTWYGVFNPFGNAGARVAVGFD